MSDINKVGYSNQYSGSTAPANVKSLDFTIKEGSNGKKEVIINGQGKGPYYIFYNNNGNLEHLMFVPSRAGDNWSYKLTLPDSIALTQDSKNKIIVSTNRYPGMNDQQSPPSITIKDETLSQTKEEKSDNSFKAVFSGKKLKISSTKQGPFYIYSDKEKTNFIAKCDWGTEINCDTPPKKIYAFTANGEYIGEYGVEITENKVKPETWLNPKATGPIPTLPEEKVKASVINQYKEAYGGTLPDGFMEKATALTADSFVPLDDSTLQSLKQSDPLQYDIYNAWSQIYHGLVVMINENVAKNYYTSETLDIVLNSKSFDAYTKMLDTYTSDSFSIDKQTYKNEKNETVKVYNLAGYGKIKLVGSDKTTKDEIKPRTDLFLVMSSNQLESQFVDLSKNNRSLSQISYALQSRKCIFDKNKTYLDANIYEKLTESEKVIALKSAFTFFYNDYSKLMNQQQQQTQQPNTEQDQTDQSQAALKQNKEIKLRLSAEDILKSFEDDSQSQDAFNKYLVNTGQSTKDIKQLPLFIPVDGNVMEYLTNGVCVDEGKESASSGKLNKTNHAPDGEIQGRITQIKNSIINNLKLSNSTAQNASIDSFPPPASWKILALKTAFLQQTDKERFQSIKDFQKTLDSTTGDTLVVPDDIDNIDKLDPEFCKWLVNKYVSKDGAFNEIGKYLNKVLFSKGPVTIEGKQYDTAAFMEKLVEIVNDPRLVEDLIKNGDKSSFPESYKIFNAGMGMLTSAITISEDGKPQEAKALKEFDMLLETANSLVGVRPTGHTGAELKASILPMIEDKKAAYQIKMSMINGDMDTLGKEELFALATLVRDVGRGCSEEKKAWSDEKAANLELIANSLHGTGLPYNSESLDDPMVQMVVDAQYFINMNVHPDYSASQDSSLAFLQKYVSPMLSLDKMGEALGKFHIEANDALLFLKPYKTAWDFTAGVGFNYTSLELQLIGNLKTLGGHERSIIMNKDNNPVLKDGYLQFRNVGLEETLDSGLNLMTFMMIMKVWAPPKFYEMMGVNAALEKGDFVAAAIAMWTANFFIMSSQKGFWESQMGKFIKTAGLQQPTKFAEWMLSQANIHCESKVGRLGVWGALAECVGDNMSPKVKENLGKRASWVLNPGSEGMKKLNMIVDPKSDAGAGSKAAAKFVLGTWTKAQEYFNYVNPMYWQRKGAAIGRDKLLGKFISESDFKTFISGDPEKGMQLKRKLNSLQSDNGIDVKSILADINLPDKIPVRIVENGILKDISLKIKPTPTIGVMGDSQSKKPVDIVIHTAGSGAPISEKNADIELVINEEYLDSLVSQYKDEPDAEVRNQKIYDALCSEMQKTIYSSTQESFYARTASTMRLDYLSADEATRRLELLGISVEEQVKGNLEGLFTADKWSNIIESMENANEKELTRERLIKFAAEGFGKERTPELSTRDVYDKVIWECFDLQNYISKDYLETALKEAKLDTSKSEEIMELLLKAKMIDANGMIKKPFDNSKLGLDKDVSDIIGKVFSDPQSGRFKVDGKYIDGFAFEGKDLIKLMPVENRAEMTEEGMTYLKQLITQKLASGELTIPGKSAEKASTDEALINDLTAKVKPMLERYYQSFEFAREVAAERKNVRNLTTNSGRNAGEVLKEVKGLNDPLKNLTKIGELTDELEKLESEVEEPSLKDKIKDKLFTDQMKEKAEAKAKGLEQGKTLNERLKYLTEKKIIFDKAMNELSGIGETVRSSEEELKFQEDIKALNINEKSLKKDIDSLKKDLSAYIEDRVNIEITLKVNLRVAELEKSNNSDLSKDEKEKIGKEISDSQKETIKSIIIEELTDKYSKISDEITKLTDEEIKKTIDKRVEAKVTEIEATENRKIDTAEKESIRKTVSTELNKSVETDLITERANKLTPLYSMLFNEELSEQQKVAISAEIISLHEGKSPNLSQLMFTKTDQFNYKDIWLNMGTGEGKSITSYLLAIDELRKGNKVVLTFSDPALMEKGFKEAEPIFKALGISCDMFSADMNSNSKESIKGKMDSKQVLFSLRTDLDFGFAHDMNELGPRMMDGFSDRVAINDEADLTRYETESSPVTIQSASGERDEHSKFWKEAYEIIKEGKNKEWIKFDPVNSTIIMSENLETYIMENHEAFAEVLASDDMELKSKFWNMLHASAQVEFMYKNGVNYMVDGKKDGNTEGEKVANILLRVLQDQHVVLINEFTGFRMPGHELQGGLMQAIQAREGVKITKESPSQTTYLPSLTMGKAKKVYNLSGTIVDIAKQMFSRESVGQAVQSTVPSSRNDMPDIVVRNKEALHELTWKNISDNYEGNAHLIAVKSLDEAKEWIEYLKTEMHAKGFTDAEIADKLQILTDEKGKDAKKERERKMSRIGEDGVITIATIAGRGNDVQLQEITDAMSKVKTELCVHLTDYYNDVRIEQQIRGRGNRLDYSSGVADRGKAKTFLIASLDGEYYKSLPEQRNYFEKMFFNNRKTKALMVSGGENLKGNSDHLSDMEIKQKILLDKGEKISNYDIMEEILIKNGKKVSETSTELLKNKEIKKMFENYVKEKMGITKETGLTKAEKEKISDFKLKELTEAIENRFEEYAKTQLTDEGKELNEANINKFMDNKTEEYRTNYTENLLNNYIEKILKTNGEEATQDKILEYKKTYETFKMVMSSIYATVQDDYRVGKDAQTGNLLESNRAIVSFGQDIVKRLADIEEDKLTEKDLREMIRAKCLPDEMKIEKDKKKVDKYVNEQAAKLYGILKEKGYIDKKGTIIETIDFNSLDLSSVKSDNDKLDIEFNKFKTTLKAELQDKKINEKMLSEIIRNNWLPDEMKSEGDKKKVDKYVKEQAGKLYKILKEKDCIDKKGYLNKDVNLEDKNLGSSEIDFNKFKLSVKDVLVDYQERTETKARELMIDFMAENYKNAVDIAFEECGIRQGDVLTEANIKALEKALGGIAFIEKDDKIKALAKKGIKNALPTNASIPDVYKGRQAWELFNMLTDKEFLRKLSTDKMGKDIKLLKKIGISKGVLDVNEFKKRFEDARKLNDKAMQKIFELQHYQQSTLLRQSSGDKDKQFQSDLLKYLNREFSRQFVAKFNDFSGMKLDNPGDPVNPEISVISPDESNKGKRIEIKFDEANKEKIKTFIENTLEAQLRDCGSPQEGVQREISLKDKDGKSIKLSLSSPDDISIINGMLNDLGSNKILVADSKGNYDAFFWGECKKETSLIINGEEVRTDGLKILVDGKEVTVEDGKLIDNKQEITLDGKQLIVQESFESLKEEPKLSINADRQILRIGEKEFNVADKRILVDGKEAKIANGEIQIDGKSVSLQGKDVIIERTNQANGVLTSSKLVNVVTVTKEIINNPNRVMGSTFANKSNLLGPNRTDNVILIRPEEIKKHYRDIVLAAFGKDNNSDSIRQEYAKSLLASYGIYTFDKAGIDADYQEKDTYDKGQVDRSSFGTLGDSKATIFETLVKDGYIGPDGIVTDKFNGKYENFELSGDFEEEQKKEIFNVLDKSVNKFIRNALDGMSGGVRAHEIHHQDEAPRPANFLVYRFVDGGEKVRKKGEASHGYIEALNELRAKFGGELRVTLDMPNTTPDEKAMRDAGLLELAFEARAYTGEEYKGTIQQELAKQYLAAYESEDKDKSLREFTDKTNKLLAENIDKACQMLDKYYRAQMTAQDGGNIEKTKQRVDKESVEIKRPMTIASEIAEMFLRDITGKTSDSKEVSPDGSQKQKVSGYQETIKEIDKRNKQLEEKRNGLTEYFRDLHENNPKECLRIVSQLDFGEFTDLKETISKIAFNEASGTAVIEGFVSYNENELQAKIEEMKQVKDNVEIYTKKLTADLQSDFSDNPNDGYRVINELDFGVDAGLKTVKDAVILGTLQEEKYKNGSIKNVDVFPAYNEYTDKINGLFSNSGSEELIFKPEITTEIINALGSQGVPAELINALIQAHDKKYEILPYIYNHMLNTYGLGANNDKLGKMLSDLIVSDPKKGLAILKDLDLGNYEYEKKNIIQESFLSLSETDPKKAKEILDYSGDEKSDILWNYAVKKTDKNRNSVDVLSDVMVRYVMPPLQHNSNEKIDNLTTMKKLKEALVEYSALNRSAAAKNSEGKSINATDVIMQKYLRQLVTTDWMTKNPEMRAEHAALNDVLNALDAVKTGKNIQDVYSSLTALDKKDGDADKSRWALFLECQSSVSITAEEKIKLTLKAAGSTKIELSTGRKLLNLISGGAKNTGNKSVLTTSDITKLTGLPQDEVVKTLSTMEKSKQLTSESTGKSLPVIEKDQAPEQKDQSKTEGTDKSKPETSVQMDEKSEKTEKTEETKKAEDDKSIYGKDQVKKNELKKSKLVEDSRSAFEIIKIDGVSLKLDANGKAQVVIDNLRYSSKAELSKLQERLAKADAKKILAKEGISSTDNIRFVWASATDINVDNEISKKLEAPGGKIQEKVNAYGPQLISMLIAYDGKNGKNIGIEQVGNSYQFIDLSTGLGIRIGDSTYLAKEEFEKLHADIQEQSQSIDKILKQACKDNGLDPENAKHQAAIKQAYSIDNTGNVRVANDVVDHGVYNLKEYVEHFGAVKVEAIIDGVKKSFYVDKEIYESIKSQQVDGAPVDKEKMDKLKSEVALESERAAIFTAIQKQGNFEKEQQEMEANFYNSLLNFKMKDIISSKRLALNLDIVAVTDFENGVVDRSTESIDRALSDIKQLNLNNVTGKDFQALENKLKQAQEDLIALNKTLTSMPENAGDEEISKIREEAQITVTKINESISSMNKDLIKIRIDNNTSSKFMINCITAESRNLDTKQIDEKVQLRDFILSVKDMPDTVSKETFTETLAKMKLSDESRVTINKLIDEQLGSKTEISKQDLMKNLQKVMITLDSELKNYPDYFADRMDAHSEAGKLIAKFVTPDNQIAVSELNGLIEKDAMLTSEQKTEIKKIIQENANGLSEIDKRVLTKGISDKLSSISDILNNNSDFVEAFNSLGYKESVVMEKYNNMVIKAKQSSAITEEMSEPDRKKVYEECWKKAQEISMSEYITYGNNNFGLKGKAMSFTYGVGKGFITGAGYTSVANLRKFATDKDYTWEQYGEELLEGGKGWAIFHMKQSAFQMLGVQAAVHSGGVGAGKIGVNAGDSALKKLGTGMKWTGKEVYSGAKGSLKGMYGEGTNAAVFTFDLLTSIADFKRNGQEGMIPMAVVNTTASWMAFEGATKAGTSVAETVFAKKMLGNVLPKKYQLAANAIGTLSGVVGSEVVGGMVSDNPLATWINSRFQMLNERNDNFHKANLMIGDFSNVQLAKVVSSGLQKGAVSDVAAIKYLSNGLKVAKGTPLVIVTASGFSTCENWGNLTSNNSQMQWAGARNVALDTGGAVVAAGGFVAGTSIAASIAAGGLTIAGVSGATGVGAPVAVVVLAGTGGAVLCTFAYEGIKESLINDNIDNKKMLNEEFGKAVPGFELKVRDEEERDTDNVKGSIEQRYNAAMINAFMQDNFTMNNVSGLSKYKNLSGYIGDYLNNDMSVVTLKDVVRNLNIKSLEMDSIYELTPDMLFNILDAAAKEKIENGAKDLDIKVSGFDNSTLNYESFGMTADFTINVNGKDIPKNDIHIANYQTQDRGGLLEARADGNIPIKEFEGFCMDDNKARPMFMRTMASLYNTGALDKLRANYEEQIKTATRMDKSADVSKYKEKIELLDQLLENMKTKNVMSLESITDVNFGQEKQNEKLVGILAEGLHCFVNGLSEKGCTNEQIASIKNIMNYKYNKESEAKELIRVGESPELIPAQAIEMINSYEKLTSDIPVDDRNSSMDIIAARISVMNKVSEVVNKINTANAKIDLAGLCEKITPEDFAKLSPDQQKMMANTLFGSLFQAYTQQKLTTQELAKELSQLLAKKPFFKEAFKSSDLNSTFLANVCTQFYNSSVAYAVFQHIIDNNPDADTIDKLFTKVTAEKISDLGDLIKNGKVTDNNLKDELIKEITTAQGAGNKGLSDFLIDNVLRKSCSVSIDEIEKLKGNDKKDQLKLNFDYKDANGKGTKESVEETSANRFRLLSACYRKGLISEDELKEKIKNNNTFEAIMLDDYSLFRSEDDIKNKSDLDAEIELLNKSMELFKQKQNELNKATLKLGKSLEVDGLKYNSQDLRMKHFIEKNNLGASASAEGNPAMIEEIWLSTKAYETGVGRFQTLYDDFMSDQAKNGKSDHNVVLGNYNQFTKDLSAFLNTNKQKYSGYFSVIAYSQNPDIVVRLNSMTPEASTDLESDFMKWADKKGVKAFTPQADVIDFKNPACINYLENMQDVCGVYMHTDNVDTSGSWNKLKDLCGQNDFSDKKVFDAHSKELCSLLDKIGKDSKLESWQTQLVEDFRAQLSGWKFGSWGSAVEDSPAAMVFLMKLSMIDDDGLQTQKRLLLTEIRKEILGAGFFDIEEKWSADFAKDYEQLIRSIDVTGMSGNQEEIEKMSEELNHYLSEINSNSKLSAISGPVVQAIKAKMYELSKYNYSQLSKLAENNDPTSNLIALDSLDEKLQKGTNIDSLLVIDGRASVYAFVLYKELNAQGRLDNLQSKDVESIKQAIKNDSYKEFKDVFDSAWYNITTTDEKRNEEFQSLTNQLIDSYKSSKLFASMDNSRITKEIIFARKERLSSANDKVRLYLNYLEQNCGKEWKQKLQKGISKLVQDNNGNVRKAFDLIQNNNSLIDEMLSKEGINQSVQKYLAKYIASNKDSIIGAAQSTKGSTSVSDFLPTSEEQYPGEELINQAAANVSLYR